MIKKKEALRSGCFIVRHENCLFILNVHDKIQTNCENVFGFLNDLLYVMNINII